MHSQKAVVNAAFFEGTEMVHFACDMKRLPEHRGEILRKYYKYIDKALSAQYY